MYVVERVVFAGVFEQCCGCSAAFHHRAGRADRRVLRMHACHTTHRGHHRPIAGSSTSPSTTAALHPSTASPPKAGATHARCFYLFIYMIVVSWKFVGIVVVVSTSDEQSKCGLTTVINELFDFRQPGSMQGPRENRRKLCSF